MNKNLTEVVFILDRSGSMSGLEADTIGGFNSMLKQQRRGEGEVYISTVLFDDKVQVLHDRENIARVEPMNDNQYVVRGCTALLDAIGGAIHHMGNVHKYAREEDRPAKTLFIIITDGMENASKHYSYAAVKKMIEHQQSRYGWEFLFLGANMDAVQEAGRFGIKAQHAVRYENDRAGTALNYEVINRTVKMARGSVSAEEMEKCMSAPDFLEPIREYREKRSRR